MGVEIKESGVTDHEFAEMEQFVYDYLSASVQTEDDGGRMRWYPWHSADYRFNHIKNVVDLARKIGKNEGADLDVITVAALFHDSSKLDRTSTPRRVPASPASTSPAGVTSPSRSPTKFVRPSRPTLIRGHWPN